MSVIFDILRNMIIKFPIGSFMKTLNELAIEFTEWDDKMNSATDWFYYVCYVNIKIQTLQISMLLQNRKKSLISS